MGDFESPELPKWQTDINIAQGIFRGLLADNPLASRFAEIFDNILPLTWPGDLGSLDLSNFEHHAGSADSSLWPPELSSIIYSFSSAEFGHGEEFL